ncbi:hypothetical protein PMAYCL1PPCAC_20171, partial [Pristionchus mayeri]
YSMPKDSKRSVLFVCLGNICRSPIAEAVFLEEVKQRGLEDRWSVDSAATFGYHTGKTPEGRAMSTLKKFGVTDYKHRARVLHRDDANDFDFIFGMDDSNIRDIKDELKGVKGKAVIDLLGSYDPQGKKHVPDPYYESGTERFEEVYHQCVRCVKAFLDKHN